MDNKFFSELSRRLKRAGIATGPVEKGRLPVLLEGQEVMAVALGGTIFLKAATADNRQVLDAYDTVAGISAQVREYTEAVSSAPPLVADGLHEGFRLLADFNGVVLAGQELGDNWGYQFVTWRRNPDQTSVGQGHFYHNAYTAAKLDFACRAGLVQESRQLTDEQLAELYRCAGETLDSGAYPITQEWLQTLTAAMERIAASVDNLDERISLSSQKELEAAQQTSSGMELGMSP